MIKDIRRKWTEKRDSVPYSPLPGFSYFHTNTKMLIIDILGMKLNNHLTLGSVQLEQTLPILFLSSIVFKSF